MRLDTENQALAVRITAPLISRNSTQKQAVEWKVWYSLRTLIMLFKNKRISPICLLWQGLLPFQLHNTVLSRRFYIAEILYKTCRYSLLLSICIDADSSNYLEKFVLYNSYRIFFHLIIERFVVNFQNSCCLWLIPICILKNIYNNIFFYFSLFVYFFTQ